MEKNTVLAIVLSVVVLVGFYAVQGIFFPPQQPAASAQTTQSAVPDGAAPAQSVPVQELAAPQTGTAPALAANADSGSRRRMIPSGARESRMCLMTSS